MSKSRWVSFLLISCLSVALANAGDPKLGKGGSMVQGAAGTDGAKGANAQLEHCDKPMATLTVAEPQDYVMQSLGRYGMQSPTSLIRMMIQQSNCFIVVDRGLAMQNMMQERDLAKSGELRQASNVGGGQMVSADFVLTPNVIFSENNAGGVGGALGGLLGGGGRLFGAIAGGLKFKEAQTSMLVTDAHSGIQVASAEGSAKKADLNIGGLLGGGGGGGALGGYSNTNEGKVIAASLLDNYNQIVGVVRGDESLQRGVGSLKQEAGKKIKAGEVFEEGDVLLPKIDGVKLLSAASDTGKLVHKLGKSSELIFSGEEKNGYVQVQGSEGEGWVKKVLVTRK
jgi:curli biogenesis system outer membrane secretion channel CsgG